MLTDRRFGIAYFMFPLAGFSSKRDCGAFFGCLARKPHTFQLQFFVRHGKFLFISTPRQACHTGIVLMSMTVVRCTKLHT